MDPEDTITRGIYMGYIYMGVSFYKKNSKMFQVPKGNGKNNTPRME